MDNCNENVIEFLLNGERATVTFSQGRYKSRIQRLAKRYPEECQIIARNKDGSICAHVPVGWVKIAPTKAPTEKQIEASRRNIVKALSTLNKMD